MARGTIKRSFKTARPVTESELLRALQGSLGPIFEHFEGCLLERDGRVLDLQISVKAGEVSLKWGVGDLEGGTAEVG